MATLLILAQAFLGAGYIASAVYLSDATRKNHMFRPILAIAFALALLHLINLCTHGRWHDHPVPFQLVIGLAAVVAVRRNEVLMFVFFAAVTLMQVEFIQVTHLAKHIDPSWATAETLIGGVILMVIADLLWAFGLAAVRGFRAAQV